MTRLNDNLQHIFLSPWLLIKKKRVISFNGKAVELRHVNKI